MGKSRGSRAGELRVYTGSFSRRIKVLAPNNPKREGSKSRLRFDLYRTGMTIAEYYLACEQAGQNPRIFHWDINWDLDHRFIELY